MKKGFTLVELLAVIVILGIIAVIVVPSVRRQIELTRDESYRETVLYIEEAARRYGTTHQLGYSETEEIITLDTLIQDGQLEQKRLINPKTDDPMSGCVYYRWNDTNNIYEYRYDENC